jgi:hypothetical protein
MSNRGSSDLPMPSSTVKERTTKVKVAGNLGEAGKKHRRDQSLHGTHGWLTRPPERLFAGG